MKRIAVIAAVLAVAACKGKEAAPAMDSIPKAAPAMAATDTAMKKMDTAMKMMDTAMKKMDTAMKKAAPAAAPAPAKKP